MEFWKRTIRMTVATALIAGSCASAALAQSATASGELLVAQQTYLDVMANLEAAGYTILETKRTLLGRVKITARNSAHLREVVVSRATGEVKHDEIVEVFLFGSEGSEQSARASSGAGISGSSNAGSTSLGATVGATAGGSSGSGAGSLSSGAGVSVSGAAGGLGSVAGEVSGGLSGGLELGK